MAAPVPSVVVNSPLQGIEMTSPKPHFGSGKRQSVLNPIKKNRQINWEEDMDRAHYVVLVKAKHEGWLRK